MGKTPPRGEKSFWSNDYNWVSISDMIDGKEINETKEMVSQKAYVNIFNNDISPKGTLLMSFKLTIGKVSILDIDSFHNEAIISIYPYFDNNYILRDYLFKILPLISNYGNTKNAIKGKTLNSKSINELIIPITNFNELSKIIKKIDYFEPILENFESKFIELDKLNNSYKEELKKSILQYAIQGKLVSQNPNDESAEVLINKILEEKRELTKTKQIKKENLSVIYKDDTDNQFYEKFDDGTIVNITDEIPFDIPSNWCWARMKNICIINPRNSLDDNLETSFIPMTLIDAGYSNSHTYEIKKWKEIKSGFTHFKENDIGFAKITPCFQNRKSTIFSNLKNGFGAGTTELHILRPINDLIYTKFIFWLKKYT